MLKFVIIQQSISMLVTLQDVLQPVCSFFVCSYGKKKRFQTLLLPYLSFHRVHLLTRMFEICYDMRHYVNELSTRISWQQKCFEIRL